MARDLDQHETESLGSTFALVALGLVIAKGSSMRIRGLVTVPWGWSWVDLLGPLTGVLSGVGLLLFALSHRVRDKRSAGYVWLRRVAWMCVWALVLGGLSELIRPNVW